MLRRWGTVALVDMLKEAVLRTGCLDAVTSVTAGASIRPDILAERLLLAIYAYGTNTGTLAVASGGHGHSEDDLRYVRRRYLTVEAARLIAVQIADATFAARDRALWGAGSTAVASDSTHVRALDQNILTEWHSRYHGRGVLIYWHVEKRSMAVHSQLISCSASEVAAMVEGAMRHDTAMDVQANYTDSHGQSEIGFAITRLLAFDLLPRVKRINKVRLYVPDAGQRDAYPRLTPALTRPIRWGIVAEQYDQMIKYATAIRTATASTEAILRRFTRSASHPTCQAMLEVGRAQKTTFIARDLRLRDLQREIEERLNVVESWNGANGELAYGKRGDMQSNRRRAGAVRALPAHPPVGARVREHAHAPRHPRRAGVGRRAYTDRPARPDAIVLDARRALRRGEPRHDLTPGARDAGLSRQLSALVASQVVRLALNATRTAVSASSRLAPVCEACLA